VTLYVWQVKQFQIRIGTPKVTFIEQL